MKPSWIKAAIAAAAAAGAAGPGVQAPWAAEAHLPRPTLHIASFLTAIDYAPYYVAKNNGCLDRLARSRGLALDYKTFASVPAMNAAVAAGGLDIVLEADTPAILQLAGGADLREITPLAALSQELLVPRDSAVRDLADLRGKRIGVLFASGYHFAVVDGLSALGVPPDAYTLVDVSPTGGAAALAGHRIDAWAIWPPILQQEVMADRGKAVPGSSSTLNVYAFGSSGFMKANGELVFQFAGCMRQSITYLKSHKTEAIPVIAKETGLPAAVIDQSWPKMAFGLAADAEAFRVLNRQAEFLLERGHITRTVTFDPSSFYDRGQGEERSPNQF